MLGAASTTLGKHEKDIKDVSRKHAAAMYGSGLQGAGEAAESALGQAHGTALDYTFEASAKKTEAAKQQGKVVLEMVKTSSYSVENDEVDTSKFRKKPEQQVAPIYSLVEKVRA